MTGERFATSAAIDEGGHPVPNVGLPYFENFGEMADVFLDPKYRFELEHDAFTYVSGQRRVIFRNVPNDQGPNIESLTKTEAKLLLFFFANPSRPIKKPEIVAAVWGLDEGLSQEPTSLAGVSISRLRANLRDSKGEIIQTTKDGYVFPNVSLAEALKTSREAGQLESDGRHCPFEITGKNELLANDKRVQVSEKKAQIARILLEEIDTPVSYQEIFLAVWPNYEKLDVQKIRTELHRLRRIIHNKLGIGEEVLEVIWGLGVKLKSSPYNSKH